MTPQDQVYWYYNRPYQKALSTRIKTDVVIIGGGMAGISAAHAFAQRGLKVVLVEQYFCGAGASGKSSGFITPDSEIPLRSLLHRFGKEKAHHIWQFIASGVEVIGRNIKEFAIDCDYIKQDTLVVAQSNHAFEEENKQEHEARIKMGYSSTLYQKATLPDVLGSTNYFGGIRYPDTFGIYAYKYLHAMCKILIDLGVIIYEETPVTAIDEHGVDTVHGRVDASYVVACVDRFLPQLNKLVSDVYQVQTYLMMSEPLPDAQIAQLFPIEPLMVWDTDLVYTYYRLHTNNRLLLGGADLFSTYSNNVHHGYASHIYKKLTSYWNNKFPTVKPHFTSMWPGLIGISKNIVPIATPDPKMSNVYYVTAATGLPWAAALGTYSARKLIDKATEYDECFSLDRHYPLPRFVQSIIGKKATFALSNLISVKL